MKKYSFINFISIILSIIALGIGIYVWKLQDNYIGNIVIYNNYSKDILHELLQSHYDHLLATIGIFAGIFGLIIPFVTYFFQYRSLKEEKEIILKEVDKTMEQKLESLAGLQSKIDDVQRGIERIDKEYPNIMPILQNMGNALNNVMFSIAQFYADRFHEQMNHIFGIRSQLSYDDIKLLLDRMLNVLISIINANNKKIYMVEYPKLKHCIEGIKKRSSAEELAKAIKIICQTAEYRTVLADDKIWQRFLGEEEYLKFQELLNFILEELKRTNK